EAENPDIDLKWVSVEEALDIDPNGAALWPDDASLRLATAGDILASGLGHGLAEQGLLLDLRPLMEADSSFNPDDFYPNMLEQYKWNGGIWGVPFEAAFTLIFFNEDIFDSAGHDYPQAGWTWDEMLVAAKNTTMPNSDKGPIWGLVSTNPRSLIPIQAHVGSLFDTITVPPTPLLAEPAVYDAVRWYTDLFLLHNVSPYLEQPEPDENGFIYPPEYDLIDNGMAAMWLESSDKWEWYSNQMNVGVAPFPVDLPGDHTTPVTTNGYAISVSTQNPEAAWRWVRFLSQQYIGGGFGGTMAVPARRSVAESSGFWNTIDKELADALRYALDHSYPIYNNVAGYDILQKAVDAIINGEKTVDEALTEAQSLAEEWVTEPQVIPETPLVQETTLEETEIISTDATIITFIIADGAGRLQSYRTLAQMFRETHPNIVVELQTINPNNGSTYPRDVAASADCFQGIADLNDKEDRNAVLSLDPFLNTDLALNQDSFFPAALAPLTYQGQVWGLPASVNVSLIAYNKDLFDAAGVSYPTIDWTTDDFLEKATALTQGRNEATKQYGYLPNTFESVDLLLFLNQLGAPLVDDTVIPPTTGFTHPATIRAIRWYTDLSLSLGVKPVFLTDPANIGANIGRVQQDREQLIRNGRAAMWLVSASDTFNNEDVDFNTGIIPFPAGPDGKNAGSFQGVTAYFISANTVKEQACWQWITFLTEQASIVSGLPARRDVAESPAFQQQISLERATAYLAAVENVDQTPFLQNISGENAWLSVSTIWLITAYDQILNDGIPVEESLDNAQYRPMNIVLA
ncbi:MAG TPA: extracellular solute-binding protein, partial [Anaerolineae bacterium]|nr:extracellular solute-binding protein [Anaerolineae bacterium]